MSNPRPRSSILRPALAILALLASASVGYGASAVVKPKGAEIHGMASLSGVVESLVPFKAAKVYLRNVDKGILNMVYTSGGRFRAVALFPGNYEVSVKTNGLESAVQKLVINAGDSPTLKVSLQPTNPTIRRIVGWGAQVLDASDPAVQRAARTYDELYPPGPGRDVLERTCMLCHGESFVSGNPGNEMSWVVRVDMMMGAALRERGPLTYSEGLLNPRNQAHGISMEDRRVLLDYLTTHFGGGAEPRFVKIDQEIPLDEAKLGKAMYMEYYLTPDPPGQFGNDPKINGRRTGQDPRFDAEGNVWLIDRGFPHRLVKLDPRTGAQKSWLFPDPLNGNHEILIDPSGMIWLPEHGGRQRTTEKRLHMFNPKTEKFERTIVMDPNDVIRHETKFMQSLAMDSKGNLYVGWIMGGALSKYEPATGKVSVFPFPNINAIPYGVVADSRDNIFIADWSRGGVTKFDTSNNAWTQYSSPSSPGHVRRLNVDREDNVWWGVYSAGKRPGFIAKLDQKTGRMTEYPVPRRNSQVYDIAQGPDGTMWSPDFGGSFPVLLNFDPRTESFAIYPTPQDADVPKVQVTRDGAIWYSPRSSRDYPGLGVLYPDMDKITSLGAYYVNGPPGYPFKKTN